MSKQIQYEIISHKGFNFNSTTYNILTQFDIKFPPHILNQIDFSKATIKKAKLKQIFRKLQFSFFGNRNFQSIRRRQEIKGNHLR